jgi:putative DNA primase/helicase
MTLGITAAAVDLARSLDIASMALRAGLPLRSGKDYAGPCPRCGGTDRFAISVRKQAFQCRGCGAKGYGAISFAQFLYNVDFPTAVEMLIGQPADPIRLAQQAAKPASSGDEELEKHRQAARLWRRSCPPQDTVVETYVRQRGYRNAIPATLRFLPATDRYPPAMIAARAIPEEPEPGILATPPLSAVDASVHIIRLLPDGLDRERGQQAKITLGQPRCRPVVLAPANDLCGLAVTEGIEDGLTVYQETGLGVWAACSANNMPNLGPLVPDYVEAVTIYAHNDEKGTGQRYADALARILDERGIEVRIEGLGR